MVREKQDSGGIFGGTGAYDRLRQEEGRGGQRERTMVRAKPHGGDPGADSGPFRSVRVL